MACRLSNGKTGFCGLGMGVLFKLLILWSYNGARVGNGGASKRRESLISG